MPQLTPAVVLAQIQQDAAERTGVPGNTWVIVAERPVQWTDTSLGVREPGMMYGRVMIPGHRVVLRNGVDGDREVVYHTGFSGSFKFSREQPVIAERELG